MLGQAPLRINVPADDWTSWPVGPLVSLTVVYHVVQFVVAGRILTRGDFDTPQKILWLLVVVLVPLGFVLYLFVAPPVPPTRILSPRPRTVGRDVSGTPWASDPGHIKP